MRVSLDKKLILRLFSELNQELEKKNIKGELYLLGGAVMCLQFNARPATMDVDAIYAPKIEIHRAAELISRTHDLHKDWLNDAVKGFLSNHAEYTPYLDLSNLKVFYATP